MHELEKNVLSGLTQDLNNIQICIERKVTPDFFHSIETKRLFEIVMWYYHEYKILLQHDVLPTVLQLSTKTSDDLKVKLIGLFTEIKTFPVSSNFELVIEELFKYHTSNLLKQSLTSAVDLLADKKYTDAVKSLKSDLVAIERINIPTTTHSGFLEEDAQQIMDEYFDRKEHPEKYKGIFIGYPSFDSVTSGLQKGTLSLIMGQMKSAKSVLVTNIARNVVKSGKKVYYHVNEGGKRLVQNRFIVCETSIPYNRVRDAQMSPEEEQKFIQYLQSIQNNNNLYIDSVKPSLSSPSYIETKIKDLLNQGPLDLVIVDHMGLMTSDERGMDNWEKIGKIALELKSLAMEYQVPIIVLTHVNRKGMASDNKKNYDLEDFGLSIEPLKHADLILSWRIVDPESFKLTHIGDGKLSIQGARDAEEAEVVLHVNTNMMKIEELVMNVKY